MDHFGRSSADEPCNLVGSAAEMRSNVQLAAQHLSYLQPNNWHCTQLCSLSRFTLIVFVHSTITVWCWVRRCSNNSLLDGMLGLARLLTPIKQY
jgi:hypothetical protein